VPVTIAAAAGAGLFEQEIATDHYRPDLAVMDGSVALAARLFDGFGIARRELDAAMVYDAFSPILLMQLEALGMCGPGEAKDFVADGNLALDGALPCNTNGGLIGEGYIHGLNLVLEAARQLRGTAVNQVPDARAVLVTASRTGAILTRG
jgi:acetyl-CoA acetyltransferase